MVFLSIFSKYRVEPFIFIFMVARNIVLVPFMQLMQDKTCLNQFNYTYDFCVNIHNEKFKNTPEAVQVFSQTNDYLLYGTIIQSVPSVFVSVLLGPWLDKYAIGSKIILIATSAAGLIESIVYFLNTVFFDAHPAYILLGHISYGLTGGHMLAMTGVFTYAMKETLVNERTARFAILELAITVSNPLANYISSLLIVLPPWLIKNQTQNFIAILTISIVLFIVSIFWASIILTEIKEIISPNDNLTKRASIRTSIQPLSTAYLSLKNEQWNKERANQNSNEISSAHYTNKSFETTEIELKQNNLEESVKSSNLDKKKVSISVDNVDIANHEVKLEIKKDTSFEMWKNIFQFKNAKIMVTSVFKKRPHSLSNQIWCIFFIYLMLLIFSSGINYIMLTYSELVYGWTLSQFQLYETFGNLFIGLTSVFVIFILQKINLHDTRIIFIGIMSTLFLNLFRGITLTSNGYYISVILGSVYLCGVVGCRALLAKLVPENELGTILGALSVTYATTPALSSLVYSQIFKYSKEIHFGFIFIFASVSLLLCSIINFYLDVKYKAFLKATRR